MGKKGRGEWKNIREGKCTKNCISHTESRPDTTAIFQINTINEQNSNKSPLSLLGKE